MREVRHQGPPGACGHQFKAGRVRPVCVFPRPQLVAPVWAQGGQEIGRRQDWSMACKGPDSDQNQGHRIHTPLPSLQLEKSENSGEAAGQWAKNGWSGHT